MAERATHAESLAERAEQRLAVMQEELQTERRLTELRTELHAGQQRAHEAQRRPGGAEQRPGGAEPRPGGAEEREEEGRWAAVGKHKCYNSPVRILLRRHGLRPQGILLLTLPHHQPLPPLLMRQCCSTMQDPAVLLQ